jgi:RHS repeat-associated protein
VVAIEGTTKTIFVGNYFEWKVSTGQVTKYYYAGSTRVGMQRGSDGVKYLLGDHLGSASVALNADGTLYGTQGYKPWGEVKFTDGAMPTEYTFTGQYSYVSSFGMMYFNARWYLPELGRFNQPDSIIPEQQQGTIAWDRLAGLNNNPVRYNDPSGHMADDGCRTEGCEGNKAETEYQKKREYYEKCKENPDDPDCPQYDEIAAFIVASMGFASIDIIATAIIAQIQSIITSILASICADGNCLDEISSAIGETGQIGQQYLQQMGGQSQAYFNTTLGGRFIDQLVNGMAYESKVGYVSLTESISLQVAKDVELMSLGLVNSVSWVFFPSPVTGLGGPSGPLYDLLVQNFISVYYVIP